ncbi:MAG: hypothetical protein ACLR7D_14485 [Lachnospira eligens]
MRGRAVSVLTHSSFGRLALVAVTGNVSMYGEREADMAEVKI